MFIDEAKINVRAGHGGPGKVSFHNPPMRGPDGGNGGRGGSVYVVGTTDLTALKQFTVSGQVVEAQNGQPGGSNQKFGRDGIDKTFRVPIGTLFVNLNTGEEFEITSEEPMLIAQGGLGGRGNAEFKSSTNTTPKFAQPGLNGDAWEFTLSLRLIADFGLIGLPNAGKSSLLNELTKAQAKVANYPFTTLEPNLGVINTKILADIPGLIEGASDGKGLGIKFLKHIEKTSALLHCIAADSENLLEDYKTIWKELDAFNSELKDKDEIILVTKSDLVDEKTLQKKLKELKKLKKEILPISIHDYDQMETLKKRLSKNG